MDRLSSSKLLLIVSVGLLVLLAACGDSEHKIGSTIKGTRIAVMEDKKTLEPDSELKGQKPQLSDVDSNTDWQQAGYDTSHVLPNARFNSYPDVLWSTSIGAGSSSDLKLLARPVVGDKHVFAMDAEGTVSAYDAKTGSQIWDFETTPEDRDDPAIGGGIGYDSGTVYATTGFGEVLALNAENGDVKWRHMLTNPLRAAPTIADGRVYVVSIDNQLSALDAKTGSVLWQHSGIAESATLMGASNPAVLGNSVIVAYSSGEIYNLRAENGRVSWNYGLTTPLQVGALPAIADIRGLPIIDRGRVIAVSHSGRIAAIDHRSGDRAWEADIGGINTPVVSGDTIFMLSNSDQLVALAGGSGRMIWVKEMQHLAKPEKPDSDHVTWAGPVLAGNVLWLVNSLGELVSFSPDDGNERMKLTLDGPAYIPPVVADGIMYVVTDDGKLVAFH